MRRCIGVSRASARRGSPPSSRDRARCRAPPCCTDAATRTWASRTSRSSTRLQYFVDNTDDAVAGRALGRTAATWCGSAPTSPLSGTTCRRRCSRTPRPSGYRLFEAVAGWLRAAAEDRPSRPRARRPARGRSARSAAPAPRPPRHRHAGASRSLSTYRDTELGGRHPLAETLAELRRVPGVERLSLGGLDERARRRRSSTDLGRRRCRAPSTRRRRATRSSPGRSCVTCRSPEPITRVDGRWVVDGRIDRSRHPGRRARGRRPPPRTSVPSRPTTRCRSRRGRAAWTSRCGSSPSWRSGRSEDDGARSARRGGPGPAPRRGRRRLLPLLACARALDARTTRSGLTRRVRLHRRVGEALEAVQPDDVRALAHHFTLAAAGGQGAELAAARSTSSPRSRRSASSRPTTPSGWRGPRWSCSTAIDDDLLRCDALTCLGQAERLLGEGEHREHLLAASPRP